LFPSNDLILDSEIKPATMHRVLIPTDFSEASLNAARFAAEMLAGKKDASAFLYHNYSHPHECENCVDYMKSLKKEFLDKGVASVEYENEMGGDLVEKLDRLAHQTRASVIVMGITGHSAMHDIFIGSNTLKMVNRSVCPVLIVPPDAKYKDIKNVAFASEFKDVERTTPTIFIKSVLEMFNPFLHIVNVNPEHYVSLTEEYQAERAKLNEMFKEYEKEFYFIGMNDFYEAIDNFIRDYNIDLLLTVPRHHKNMNALFQSSHTRKLAYHSHVPFLAAHA
jgi:nucleotide-binding universal stress UspA family protein